MVGLFIPCYVNALYPHVGISTYKLLQFAGYEVDYPENQTCCGQPMGNAGYQDKAEGLMEHFLDNFEKYEYIVAPSASCVSFVKHEYAKMKHKDPVRVQAILDKTYEICTFLQDKAQIKNLPAQFQHKVSLHNSCHGVRILGLSSASECHNIKEYSVLRNLLTLVAGIEVMEPDRKDECCGFGGLFAIEEADVSGHMGIDKIKRHMQTGAQYITGADSSCLMHLQGIIDKYNYPIQTIHITEILSQSL